MFVAFNIGTYNEFRTPGSFHNIITGTLMVIAGLVLKLVSSLSNKAVSTMRSNPAGRDAIHFVQGGNAKVSAERISDAFFNHQRDYQATLDVNCARMVGAAPYANNLDFLQAIENEEILNFVDLVVLDLHTFAAPRGTPLRHTEEDFREKAAKLLRGRGIPEQFISGDNRNRPEPVRGEPDPPVLTNEMQVFDINAPMIDQSETTPQRQQHPTTLASEPREKEREPEQPYGRYVPPR